MRGNHRLRDSGSGEVRGVSPQLPEDGCKDPLLSCYNPAPLRAWQSSMYPEALSAANTLSFCSHGAEEKTQVQTGKVTCSWPHRQLKPR